LSLDAERAQAPPRSGAGRRALAAITLAAAAPQTLPGTGSSLMAPLFALWGPAYHARFSQVTLRTTSSSSGTGIDSAAAGPADIGASDAYLSPATRAKHAHLVNIPLAVAALMVVYNVPGISQATHLKLDGKLLARTYAGQITSWDDPAIATANPGVKLPGTGIVLVHRGDDSGNYEYAIVSTAQGSAVRARDLRAFLSWAITSGAAQLAQVNFQPLPSPVVTLSGTQIAEIKG
jgi:ABC-type phosphate transport system substrate-binding protein